MQFSRVADLFQLVCAPTGGRALVGASPALICPGPGGLQRERERDRERDRERERERERERHFNFKSPE